MTAKKSAATRIKLDATESTNNYAMEMIRREEAQDGMLVWTKHQTSGKGQRGKTWITPPDTALTLSYIADSRFLQPAQYFRLLATVAVIVRNWAASYLGEDETRIKWPNDLYWRDRKAGGILIENVIRGEEWKWAVIGIGININQSSFSEGMGRPVSFLQVTGKTFDICSLADELSDHLKEGLEQLTTSGFEPFFTHYNEHLWMKGQYTLLEHGRGQLRALIQGADTEGYLLAGENSEFRFGFHEVSWII